MESVPTVVVKGVYPVPISEDFVATLAREYMADTEYDPPELKDLVFEEEKKRYRELLADTVLIELVIEHVDERFSAADLLQETPGKSKSYWQAAWMEKYLDSSGTRIIPLNEGLDSPSGELRIAYYLNVLDSTRPIQTSYGSVSLPAMSPMPERLWKIMRWEDF